MRDEMVIPVNEERLNIEKRVVPTGTVRILKTVHQRQELVDEPLQTETFDVRRIPINRPLDGPVEVRHEGDTTVYPVVEEVLVITKQLMLREEIHVTRRVAEVHHPQIVTLSSDEIKINREPAPDTGDL